MTDEIIIDDVEHFEEYENILNKLKELEAE